MILTEGLWEDLRYGRRVWEQKVQENSRLNRSKTQSLISGSQLFVFSPPCEPKTDMGW